MNPSCQSTEFRPASLARALSALTIMALAAAAFALNPSTGDFSKSAPTQVRLVTWNTHGNFGSTNAATDAAMTRVLRALSPDVLALEETPASMTAAQVQTKLGTMLPPATWQVQSGLSDGTNRNVLASRRPLSMKITDVIPAAGIRGVTAALVSLDRTIYAHDIYVMAVHLKCCSGAGNTADRQDECDALAHWFGDLRTAGGNVNLPASTPAVVMGDFNLVDPDPQKPEVTLRTGAIVNTATFGAAIAPDWDGTALLDAQPHDLFTGSAFTWPSGTTTPTSRLDRFYVTDSVLAVADAFALNTLTMTAAARTPSGFLAGDSAQASDHLPVVVDLKLTGPGAAVEDWPLY